MFVIFLTAKKSLYLISFLIIILSSTVYGFGIISTNGTQFIEDNHPFYYVGFNSQVQPGGEYTNIDYTFREASRLGINVIRIWALGEGFSDGYQPSPGNYNETTFRNLDYKLAMAQKYGIRLIIALANNWGDYGGIPQYVTWTGDSSGVKEHFFTNDSCKTLYRNYVSTLINRTNTITGQNYKNDPTVFSWELMNEPRYQLTWSDATLTNWIIDMSDYIRSLDSTHMISTGLEGLRDAWYPTGTNYTTQHLPANISFCTFHIYPNAAGWTWPFTQSSIIQPYLSEGHSVVGKPVIMEEFGLDTGFSDFGLSSCYQLMLNEIYTNNGDGSNIWYWSAGNGSIDSGLYNLSPNDPSDVQILSIFRKNANLMLKKTYGNLPDLDIQPYDISFNPKHPAIGQTFYITATVENNGNSDANNVLVQFFAGDPYNDGQQIGTDHIIPLISANSTETVTEKWIMPGKTTDIYILLDANSTISELTKYNNDNFRTMTSLTTIIESFESETRDWSTQNYASNITIDSTNASDGNKSLSVSIALPGGGFQRAGIVRYPSFNNDWTTYGSGTLFCDVYCSSSVAPLYSWIVLQCNDSWDWYQASQQIINSGWNTIFTNLNSAPRQNGRLVDKSIHPEVWENNAKTGIVSFDNFRIVNSYTPDTILQFENFMGDYDLAEDTSFWAIETPANGAPAGLPALSWETGYSGRNGIWHINFSTSSQGIKLTSFQKLPVDSSNPWYKICVTYYSTTPNDKHELLPTLLLYDNYSTNSIRQVSAIFKGNGLVTPNSWNSLESYCYARASSIQLQLSMKNYGSLGDIYIDSIELLQESPPALLNPTPVSVPYGDFDISSDTTRWAYQNFQPVGISTPLPTVSWASAVDAQIGCVGFSFTTANQAIKITSIDTFSIPTGKNSLLSFKIYSDLAQPTSTQFLGFQYAEQNVSQFKWDVSGIAEIGTLPGQSWTTYYVPLISATETTHRLQLLLKNISQYPQTIYLDDIQLIYSNL